MAGENSAQEKSAQEKSAQEKSARSGSTPCGSVNLELTEGNVHAPTAQEMRQIGAQLGQQLEAGTVVVLTGPLGAGKTTLTQGIALGLGVRGRVQSPTFTIVRTHKPGGAGQPGMLHMDAYRLLGQDVADGVQPGMTIDRDVVLDAMESLDIDADLDGVVLVAEWGRGVVEMLSEKVLDVEIVRDGAEVAQEGDEADQNQDARRVYWRWV